MAPQPQRRRYAFTAIQVNAGWAIVKGEEGVKGYTSMPDLPVFAFTQELSARDYAADLNRTHGWDKEADAALLILGTMAMRGEPA